jgi:hypothetical protein
MANLRSTLFHAEANGHLNVAAGLLGNQVNMAFSPYHRGTYHAVSLLYPLCDILKTLIAAVRMVKGVCLLVHALFNAPAESIPQVLFGLGKELVTTIVNALNVIASLVFFVTRTLATLFNLGYTASQINEAGEGVVVDGFNWDSALNFLAGAALVGLGAAYESSEHSVYESTTNLIA